MRGAGSGRKGGNIVFYDSKRSRLEIDGPCGSTVLCLDYRQAGIGSNSCGPELAPFWAYTNAPKRA